MCRNPRVSCIAHVTSLGIRGEANAIPALEGLVLDFDHYGRLVGIRVTGAVHSVLSPSLLEAGPR